jgi:hypothetical protein
MPAIDKRTASADKAVHRAIARELGRGYRYSENGPADYTNIATGQRVEHTTNNPATFTLHVLRNPDVPVVTYDPDDF